MIEVHELTALQSAWQVSTVDPFGNVLIRISFRPPQPLIPGSTVYVGTVVTSLTISVVIEGAVIPTVLGLDAPV